MRPIKFIIYRDEIILGRVSFHENLLPIEYDYDQVFGGGIAEIDNENQTVTLFGQSYQFGPFNRDKAESAVFADSRLKNYDRVMGDW